MSMNSYNREGMPMKAKRGGKLKAAGLILLTLLPVILLAAGLLIVRAVSNRKTMNALIDEGVRAVSVRYTITKQDTGGYAELHPALMTKLRTVQYRVEELGNLSVMTKESGLRQTAAFTLTPFEKNMPLCRLEVTYFMGTRKLSAEFYDLVGDTATQDYQQVRTSLRNAAQFFSGDTDLPAEPHWYDSYLSASVYKKMKSRDDDRTRELFLSLLEVYLEESVRQEKSTAEEAARQFEITKNYSESLLEKGSPSADMLKETFGEAKTRDFFGRVLFGTEAYQPAEQQTNT